MAYTLGEAAKASGISKTSLHRAIKSGKVSAARKDDGSYEIDPAELHRVYPLASNSNSSMEQVLEQTVTPEMLVETGALRREAELLRERLADKDSVIGDLRNRLDQSEQERRAKDQQLNALLTDQREKPAPEQAQPTPAPPAQRTEQPKGWRGLLIRLAG